MNDSQYDLFIVLLKLKSYLVSMVEEGVQYPKEYYFTEEYLELKYPEQKDEILNLLSKFNLNCDKDIVFNERVHQVFRDMAGSISHNIKLENILKEQNISSINFDEVEKYLENFQHTRDENLKNIIATLLNIVKNWSGYQQIEKEVDDYIALDEKEVLRPDEESKYESLDRDAEIILDKITVNTKDYLASMVDFLFQYCLIRLGPLPFLLHSPALLRCPPNHNPKAGLTSLW